MHYISFLQQIQEKHATKMCDNSSEQNKTTEKTENVDEVDRKARENTNEDLNNPVTEAAKNICRKILRYKGNNFFVKCCR